MSSKILRYFSWGLAFVLISSTLFVNKKFTSKQGFFTSEIRRTMAYDLLYDAMREIGYKPTTAKNQSYFLWFICLAGCSVISWNIRLKTGELLIKIHDNV